MTDGKIRRVHGIYGTLTAALSILAGISLILACLAIYNGGEGVFSRESVWTAFLSILVPILLCVLALLGGLVLSIALPLPSKKASPDMSLFLDRAKVMRDRLLLRADLSRAGENVRASILRESRLRDILRAGYVLFASVCAIPPLVHFLNFANFPNENLTAEVLAALYVLVPCLSLALTLLYAVSSLTALSYERECEALRTVAALETPSKTETDGAGFSAWLESNEKVLLLALRGGVFALAVAFILLGIGNGGMNDVLQKAIRICTECIGLG